VVTGVTIRGNMIINYVDPDQPFRGTVQGIGCFDGMFEDWLIEHNVIVVDTWHGITLRGAVNCTIRNNTICDRNSSRPGPPWIRLDHHKNGTPSRDNVVTCNLSTRYDVSSSEADMSDNLTIRDPRDWVVDYDVLNMRIKDDSPARGGASDGGDIGAYLFVGQLPDDVTAVLTGGEKPMDYAVRDGAAPGSQVSRIGSTVELFDLQGRCRFFATPKIKQMAPGTYILRDAGRARMKSPLIQKR